MKLVEEGKIDLDVPVQRYLESWNIPETEFNIDGVTVRRLLSGTAGMPLGDIDERYSPATENIPTLRQTLSRNALLFQEPGSSFSYSNTGFNILELLIEELSRRDFSEYMEKEILKPLGMERASFQWRDDFSPPVATGYGNGGEALPVYVYPYNAAGDLFGTLEDIAHFAAAGMTRFAPWHRGVLSSETVESMYTVEANMSSYYRFVFDGYGFGHFIEYLEGENSRHKAVSHGGQGAGWMTDFHLIPSTGDGIVILSNSQRTWPGFAHILSDWAKWNGFVSIGMGAILTVQKIAWVLITLTLALLLWQVGEIVEGTIAGSRRLKLSPRPATALRWTQLTAAFIFLGAFLGIQSLEYWFIDSVLPVATNWIDFTLLLAAGVLGAGFFLPREESR